MNIVSPQTTALSRTRQAHGISHSRIAFIFFLFLVADAAGKTENPPQGVWLDPRARLQTVPPGPPNPWLDLEGYFMSPDPSNPSGTRYDSYDFGWGPGTSWIPVASSTPERGGTAPAPWNDSYYHLGVAAQPGKAYQFTVSPSPGATGDVFVAAPPGYKILLCGENTGFNHFNGTWLYWVQVFPSPAAPVTNKAAEFLSSATITMAINWELHLGSLKNGGSAGRITLSDAGTRADWSVLFTPAYLSFETASDEIAVYRNNDVLRQIIANEVAVDIVTLSATSYEMRCYDPDQIQINNTDYPRTFSGSPYITYRIEQGTSTTSIKITRETRNITDFTTSFPIARSESMLVTRTNTGAGWKNFTWTRTAWTLDGQTPVAQTSTSSTDQGSGNRSEQITVSADGAPSTTSLRITRNYSTTPTALDLVTSESIGTTASLTTNLAYYTDYTANYTNLLNSATLPGGGWAAFDYIPSEFINSSLNGLIHYEYRPYGGSPSVVTKDQAQGAVRHYEYSNNEWGAPVWPALTESYINGTLVEKSTYAYTFDQAYPNSHSVTRTTRTDYTGSNQTLTTILSNYRNDWGQTLYRGQPFSIKNPDGSMKSYAYEIGRTDGTSFWTQISLSSMPASRVTVITGSSDASAGTQLTSWGGKDIEWIYLIDGKSTAECTIRDDRAQVVREEKQAWIGGQWQVTTWTNYTYDLSGNLVGRSASNGATYSATWDGGLKTSETDENGVVTTYTYDAARRVLTSTRQGSGVIGTLVTKYTYDASDRVLEERVGWGQTEQIVTTRQYDDAGRIISETQPGLGATTHSYDVAARTHTMNRPDGGNIVETRNIDGELASKTGSSIVPEYYTYGVETAVDISGRRWRKTEIGISGAARWTKRTNDWIGRQVKYEHPGFSGGANYVEENFYDATGALGHKWKTTKTGMGAVLYQYNALGQLFRSGVDVNGNNTLDLASTDRIDETEAYYESYAGAYWLRSDSRTYPFANANTSITTATNRTRLTGFPGNRVSEVQSVDPESVVVSEVFDVNRSARTATKTRTKTGLSGSETTGFVNGLPTSVTTYDGLTTTTGYDTLLRANTSSDPRSNVTTTVFVAGTTRPSTVTDDSGAQTAFHYDSVGRKDWVRDQRNYYTRFSYNYRDQMVHQWGDGAVPVEYGYDNTYGDRTTMSTFRSGSGWDGSTWPATPGAADTTTWSYDAGSGLLASKTDALNRTLSQTFCSCGKISGRTLSRGITISYGYDSSTGEMTSVTYSDGTPAVSYTYTRMGQTATVTDATGTRTLMYDLAKPWRLNAESFGSFYNNRAFTRLYEATGMPGRIRGYQLGSTIGGNDDVEETFGYAGSGRFETLTSGRNGNAATRTFRYAYAANSALVGALSIDGGHPFTVNRTYDPDRDLVASIETKWSVTTRSKYDLTYDERRNRTALVQSGDVFSDYGAATHRIFQYDGRGELTADVGYLGATATDQAQPLPGRRFEYAYENAGNRSWSNHTGVAGTRENYTHNALNQMIAKENNSQPSWGTTDPANAVTVDGAMASRQGQYFSGEVLAPASSAPSNYNFIVAITPPGQSTTNESRYLLALASLQSYSYDLDGNLSSDGLWDYTWDGENRLVRMATTAAAVSNGIVNREITFKYDYLHRRVQKRVVNLGTSGEISSRRYLYDGWNLIAEFTAPGGTSIGPIIRSYTWGLDIVHSLTSAGGVGALLQIADHASGKTYLPTYDGNGNIASLVNADTGSLAATYEYSPFGEPLRAQTIDSTVGDQPFRFSTKFFDLETGLVYYGRRYYDPKLGRWLSRDPKEELGGINLYGFIGNNAINRWDYLGMCDGDDNNNEDNSGYGDGENAGYGDGSPSMAFLVNGQQVGSISSTGASQFVADARMAGVQVDDGFSAGSSSTPDPTRNGQPYSNYGPGFGKLPTEVISPNGTKIDTSGNMVQSDGRPLEMTPFTVTDRTGTSTYVNPDFAAIVTSFGQSGLDKHANFILKSTAVGVAAPVVILVGGPAIVAGGQAVVTTAQVAATNGALRLTTVAVGAAGASKNAGQLRIPASAYVRIVQAAQKGRDAIAAAAKSCPPGPPPPPPPP